MRSRPDFVSGMPIFQALTVNDPATFNNLVLFHIVNGTLENVTSSLNFSTRTVCGTVTSLSPFVLFNPTTSTALGSSLNPSTYGQSVTFTAMVTASGGTPTGTVTFYDGANALGTGTLNSSGQATLSTAALSGGTQTITAVYGGDGKFVASTSVGFAQTVNKAYTTSAITAQSANPSVAGQPVTVSFRVSPVAPGSGTPTGNVTVSDGSGDSCTGTVAAGGCSLVFPTVGAKTLTASYAGRSNFNSSTSASVAHKVTDFSIAVSPTSQTIKAGQKTTYTITMTPLGGFTGTVALSCGGVPPSSTCLLSKTSVVFTGSSSATVYGVLSTSGKTPSATYRLSFTGIYGTGAPATGGLTHSANVTLTVQ